MDNMELLTKVYKLIGEQTDEIGKVRIEQARRQIYEVELEQRCFESMESYVEVAAINRINRLRERVRELEKRTNELEDLVKRQGAALELYSELLAKVEVDVNLLKKGVKL